MRAGSTTAIIHPRRPTMLLPYLLSMLPSRRHLSLAWQRRQSRKDLSTTSRRLAIWTLTRTTMTMKRQSRLCLSLSVQVLALLPTG